MPLIASLRARLRAVLRRLGMASGKTRSKPPKRRPKRRKAKRPRPVPRAGAGQAAVPTPPKPGRPKRKKKARKPEAAERPAATPLPEPAEAIVADPPAAPDGAPPSGAASGAPRDPVAAEAGSAPATSRPRRRRAGRPRARERTTPTAAGPWNILFLGGSNTVMRNGFADALVACLSDRLGAPGRVTNLAAGGNSTLHGLMLAKQRQDLADYDIVVIEYAVNDVKLAKSEATALWSAATEGLLRHLLAVRPDAHVVFALLGRRDMARSYLFRPARATLEIVAHYAGARSVTLVDIDHLLRDVLFPDAEGFAALYSDGAHYRRPHVARLIGALAASEILSAPGRNVAPLPEPLSPWHFADATLIDLTAGSDGERKRFVNSRFDIETLRIRVGQRIAIEAPGALAAIEFVSVPSGATLRVSEDGEPPFALHTRHERSRGARFPFLLRCQALEGRPWSAERHDAHGVRRITIEALEDAPEGELKKAPNMVSAARGSAGSIHLTRLLCVP